MKDTIKETMDGPAGKIPRVSFRLSTRDRWETLMVRLSFRRMKYTVKPGLYALGNPGPDSPVMVTANFKLSFDALRKELAGIDTWILVLDTKGVNVWCAAGKGTFGTEELVKRVKGVRLEKRVNHRRLIVPQLGAPGISAHNVKKESGFSVLYGPVRASDIPAFLEAGKKTTPEMRRVRFTLKDRLILTPVETVQGFKILVFVMAVFFLLSGLDGGGYSLEAVKSAGPRTAINLLLAYFSGVLLGPALLPWLPARQFFVKGIYTGLMAFAISYLLNFSGSHLLENLGWLLLIPALSSFIVMNFTGASTYTSLSGVRKEMRLGVPLQAVAGVLGSILWISARFV